MLLRTIHRTLLAAVAPVVLLAFAPAFASAQHTGFTLFGSPSAEGNALPAERVAVHPVSDPYFHEDSFVTTDARAWFVYHSFPDSTALNGGDAEDYALQLRLALTDRLQLVAYKDGYMHISSGLVKESGWNDLAAGLKYNLIQDWKNDFHASVGAGYQFAIGDPGVLQNDQEIRLWGSLNKGFDKLHLGFTFNYFFHTGNQDTLGSSDRCSLHFHGDYYVCKWFSPVLESNMYFVTDRGNEVPGVTFSGADIANLGGGSDLITGAIGFEVRPCEHVAIRAAYETDLTSGDSLYGYRWTFSAIYSF
jgi:hypothetical protein